MQRFRILMGCFVWLGTVVGVWQAMQRQLGSGDATVVSLSSDISQWVTGQRTDYSAESDIILELAVGDPVVLRQADGSYRQVGTVRDNFNASRQQWLTRHVTVSLYDAAVAEFPDGFELRYFATPTSLSWVAATLISEDRQRQIAKLIAADWERHHADVLRNLTPVVQEAVKKALVAIEAELPATIERHRGDFTHLGERYKSEVMQKQMLPLVRERVLPLIEEELRPLVSEIGRSLWNRVSLWSFTWRYLYDVSPLPERNTVQREFDRFLEQEAMPELRAHTADFVAATERIVARVSRDPVVNDTIRRSLRMVASDPELHAIVWDIVQDAVVKNQTLRRTMDEHWKSPSARSALQLASSRFEPTARAIGDLIIGSREGGITPEFARILRAQILLKDRHWLVVVPASTAARTSGRSGVRVVRGTEPMTYPLSFEGSAQSPLSEIR